VPAILALAKNLFFSSTASCVVSAITEATVLWGQSRACQGQRLRVKVIVGHVTRVSLPQVKCGGSLGGLCVGLTRSEVKTKEEDAASVYPTA